MGFMKIAIFVALVSVAIYLARPFFNGPMCGSDVRMDGKVVIVTGANTGIGLETAVDLVARGARVYLACRSIEKAERASRQIQERTGTPTENSPVLKLDLASLKSVREFVKEFKKRENRLDVLINNAGVALPTPTFTEDGFETHIGVNHLGHFLLTNLLLDLLKTSAPSRVVTVTGKILVWAPRLYIEDLNLEKNFGPIMGYAHSKLANVLFSNELARRLKGTGVTSNSLHPGVIKTALTGHLEAGDVYGIFFKLYTTITGIFYKDIIYGAQTQICCAVDPNLTQVTGKYFEDCQETEQWTQTLDEETAQKLWQESEKLVKL